MESDVWCVVWKVCVVCGVEGVCGGVTCSSSSDLLLLPLIDSCIKQYPHSLQYTKAGGTRVKGSITSR